MNTISNTVSVETILLGQHDIYELKGVCRLCGVCRHACLDIFDEKHHYRYEKVINSHFKDNFQISKDDVLPAKLCGICRAKLTAWHEFYHNCLVVNKKFQQLAEKLNLAKTSEEKQPDVKPSTTGNDIEVIEVTVDNIAENCLFNESENSKTYDISNVNINETNLLIDAPSENDFDPLDDFSGVSDNDEEVADKDSAAEFAELPANESQMLIEVHDKADEVNLENIKVEETTTDIDYPNEEEMKVEEFSPMNETVDEEIKNEKRETASSKNNDVSKKKKTPRRAFRICHLCGKNYNTESGFRHHLIMHEDPSFSCHLCGSVFYEAQNLKKHLAALHSDERPFQCHLCGNKYKRKDVLQEHIKRVHDGIKRVWNKETTRKYRSKIQKKFHHNCPYCNKVLASKAYLNDHINGVHTKEEKYKCNECAMMFTRKSSFKYHFKRAHILKKNVLEPRGTFLKDCEYCGLQFQIKKYYDQHVAAKHFNTFKCTHCEEVFDNKYQLTKHVDSAHADIICRCPFCNKGFGEDLHLKRHIYVCHTDRKPYECHQCGYKANKKATLEVHIRRHTGERPYQCDMCPRKFTQSVDYRKHRANHMKKV